MATKCCARNIILDSILYPDPSSQCDTICLTVADPSFLPDPATDCEFAEVRFVDLTGFALAIYQWDGFSWQVQVGVVGAFSGSDITDVNYQTFGDWTATLNGNAVSGAGTYTFDPAVQSLDVVFINGACSYPMEEITPPVEVCSTYTLEYLLWPSPFFIPALYQNGSVNGATIGGAFIPLLQAFMASWESHSGVVAGALLLPDGIFFTLVRTTASDPFTTFGEYTDLNEPPDFPDPLDLGLGETNCVLNCYTVTFTVPDPTNTELEVFYIFGDSLTGYAVNIAAPAFNINSPTIGADIIAYINTNYGIADPEMTIEVSVDGNDVTVTINSLLTYTELAWNNTVTPSSGLETFSSCP